MKKLSLILLSVSLIPSLAVAQTKRTSKTRKNSVQSSKKTTPNQQTAVKKTIASEPAPKATLTTTLELSKFETEIVAELNLFRTNPQEYAKYLEDFLKTYDGNYFINQEGVKLISIENKVPVTEVITILKQTKPLPEFKLADGLIKAAAVHAQDLVKNNRTGHRGTNGSLPDERVGNYGIVINGPNENISYGAKTARDVVLTMLIDDGNASRSHRKNLLNPGFKVIGLATGEIKDAGTTCVLVLAGSFTEKLGSVSK